MGQLAYRFVWIEDGVPALGGQWLAFPPDGVPQPCVLSDAVAAHRTGSEDSDPLPVHVEATYAVVQAAGELEDAVLPDAASRLRSTLAAMRSDAPEVEPESEEGMRLRQAAEALEKLAADLAELIEEQLDGGSLATLPPGSTRALCQATQTAWRLRHRIDPPTPLYL